jgi:hypothetical protein
VGGFAYRRTQRLILDNLYQYYHFRIKKIVFKKFKNNFFSAPRLPAGRSMRRCLPGEDGRRRARDFYNWIKLMNIFVCSRGLPYAIVAKNFVIIAKLF